MESSKKSGKIWSADEILLLKKELVEGVSIDDIAAYHSRSVGAIIIRIAQLRTGEPFDDTEKSKLTDEFKKGMSLGTIAKEHQRSLTEIKTMAKSMGFDDLIPKKNVTVGKGFWTVKESDALVEFVISGMDLEDIAIQLERPLIEVKDKLGDLYYNLLRSTHK